MGNGEVIVLLIAGLCKLFLREIQMTVNVELTVIRNSGLDSNHTEQIL